ncbi:hypothetical protein [Spiroplasma culicicola]|uniref:Uncharacterized protein n=1 Tax=Spiroplasma culicicola AES-1 TaxID=1276246 RepID=W6A6K8_9MOLU|nr:hypothetical protein [Spiroplasma culicicola]AHI52606.1 hypothetical protein SCULI_v1c02650 [Spiroplasma culicicola AES-1]
MPKDLNNLVEIREINGGDFSPIVSALDSGKTLLWAVKRGDLVNQALAEGRVELLNANCELKEEAANCGTCGCGEPADALVYLWRD